MADAITTDQTLMDTGLIIEEMKRRLTPAEWVDDVEGAGPWDRWHQQAWTEMLRHYAAMPDPITESDITDTAPLMVIAHHYVLYLAWMTSGHMEEQKMWHSRYKEHLTEISPPVSGGTANTSGMSITMNRA